MTYEKQLRFWLIGLVVLLVLLFLLRSVLLPFVLGMAIAYFLDPLTDRMERLNISRWLATTIVLVSFFFLFILFAVLIVPIFASQLSGLLAKMPAYLDSIKSALDQLSEFVRAKADPELVARLREALESASGKAFGIVANALGSLVTQGAALANFISLIVITPVVAFYLLRDWDLMVSKIGSWLPRRQKPVILHLASEVNRTLSGFLRGQGMVCLLLGCFYALGLTLAGLDFGLAIGLMAGLLTFIPYAGSIFGLLLSVGLAALQFDSWINVAIVAVVFFVGQLLEGNVLTPKLVGDKVGLHPVWVIFALFAFGALFGFVGVLIAVPAAAIIGVAVRFGLELYLDSKYFDADRQAASDGSSQETSS